MISPELLIEDGLLTEDELEIPSFPDDRVDFGPVIESKNQILAQAWSRFQSGAATRLQSELDAFCEAKHQWLDDYALFMAIKEQQGGRSWHEWPDELRMRQSAKLDQARTDLDESIREQKFRQFLFFRQWSNLKKYAAEKQIRLIGDIPIFVSSDSADVWANPSLFQVDEHHRPTVVAGVPPDYFCETGQLWGNPHYNWDAMRQRGYAWWIQRAQAMLEQVDWIRLDHFCGFEAAWHVPAGDETAIDGEYRPGPGSHFFQTLNEALDGLPFIAEDLGIVTKEVEALRDEFSLPGMKVLHFAFGDTSANPFLPHNYVLNSVAYTGTHDNNTSRGWYQEISNDARDRYRRYTGRDGEDVSWDLIRLAWSSVSAVAIAPLQDILDLGEDARMNLPGRAAGNWSWRFT